MKVSVSLPDEDIKFIDTYAQAQGHSRSAALHHAVTMLRAAQLGPAYAAAFDEWETSGDAVAWEVVVSDGLV
ncbi:MAG: ribbon-helix-helix domain-containing protein [Actinomycetota bacterium]|nr:ribbon-helix-helix domain-containing protein [Actinomycetota bacterium]